MNKRGASHTDWAISMAIFIMYILLLIIFLKPGVAPIYKPEGLMQLVEDNFFEETSWVVRETWLDIKECSPKPNGAVYINCAILVNEVTGNWKLKLSNKDDLEKTVRDPLSFGDGDVYCNADADNNLGSIEDKKFRIVYALNPPENKNRDENLIAEADPKDPDFCDIGKLGASIESEGLNENLVDILKAKDVNYFKDTWGFPTTLKGFKIIVKNQQTSNEDIITPLGEPSEDANVFVRETNTVYLNEDNTRVPIVVHIEVW